jgi:DNA mismatch repair protein MutS
LDASLSQPRLLTQPQEGAFTKISIVKMCAPFKEISMEKQMAASTPMMQQYLSVHKKLPQDTILFFRLGDFYEMFFDDAETGAKILGLTLTQRSGIPMAGIPFHASETYIDKLLKAGKKVAICDQMEAPQPGKKLVDRSLTRILTPGTVLEDSQIESKSNHYILCVTLDHNALNAAWLDLSTSEFTIASETQRQDLLSFLCALDVKEIVLSERTTQEHKTFLAPLLCNKAISELPHFAFEQTQSRKNLEKLLGVQHLEGFGIPPDCLALGCANALVAYITENLFHSPKNLNKITLHTCAHNMILDASTVKNLEIFQTQQGTREGSLLSFLDNTKTAAGSRLVQHYLTYPLLDLRQIQVRQNLIQIFYDQPLITRSIQECLKRTRDLNRILSRLYNRLRTPRELGAIRETLDQLPFIKAKLQTLDSPEVQHLTQNIHLFQDLLRHLQDALEETLPNDLTEGNYIRAGYDETLDQLRSTQVQNKTWLQDFERTEQQRTGIRNLRVKYNAAAGFFIEVTKSNLNLVPCHYVRKQTMAHVERYSTEELKAKEDFILHGQTRAIEREKVLFAQLVEAVLVHASPLQQTAQTLAEIDVFTGWSCLARNCHYTKPNVDTSTAFEIEAGRHPLVEASLRANQGLSQTFVANDLHLDAQGRQILILTGPNMAGKSTYIRQNALMALMAHMGCWVPAQSCRMGWVDRIFSRIGASDDLARGQSTFMVEMLETANILNNATQRSLIILDEIGRGTSTYDGLSIAWSVVEYLHRDAEMGPRTLFATHYRELTQLEKLFPRIFNAYIAVKEWNDEILFVHQICAGCAHRSYGIQVAKLAGLPTAVIERAKTILASIESEGKVLRKLLHERTPPSDTQPQLDLL